MIMEIRARQAFGQSIQNFSKFRVCVKNILSSFERLLSQDPNAIHTRTINRGLHCLSRKHDSHSTKRSRFSTCLYEDSQSKSVYPKTCKCLTRTVNQSRCFSTHYSITCMGKHKHNLALPKYLLTWQRCYSKDKDDVGKDSDVKDILTDLKTEKETFKIDSDLKAIIDEIKDDFQEKSPDSTSSDSSDDEKTINPAEPKKVAEVEEYIYDYRYASDIEDFTYDDGVDFEEEEKKEKIVPIPLVRGMHGVFELDELLTFLDHLGAENVVTVPVPPEANYCDYMVVCSAKSKRHLQYINDEFLWTHKRKKNAKDGHLIIEGREKSDWSAMDLGNIVLHVFFGDTREYYDIESLWTLGPDKDPKCQELVQDPYALSEEDLFWLEAAQLQGKETGGGQSATNSSETTPGKNA